METPQSTATSADLRRVAPGESLWSEADIANYLNLKLRYVRDRLPHRGASAMKTRALKLIAAAALCGVVLSGCGGGEVGGTGVTGAPDPRMTVPTPTAVTSSPSRP